MSVDVMVEDWEAVTAEQVKEAEEGDLIPKGEYEGQLQDYTVKLVEDEKSGLNGAKVARCTAELFDVEGKPRKYFFGVTPKTFLDKSGRQREETRLAAHLAKATGTVGQPFGETLEAAKNMRLRFKIRKTEAKGVFEARNWTDAISAA